MTLFCYGAIEVKSDPTNMKNQLTQIADGLGWNFDFTYLEQNFSLERLFNIQMNPPPNLLVYEVIANTDKNRDLNKAVYADFGGELMLHHYREIAKKLDVSNWQNLEFGELDEVNRLYEISPVELPLIRFLEKLLDQFPEQLSMICLNQDFDFGDKALEVIGTKNDLNLEIWKTISYGYSWPNLRLIHDPYHAFIREK